MHHDGLQCVYGILGMFKIPNITFPSAAASRWIVGKTLICSDKIPSVHTKSFVLFFSIWIYSPFHGFRIDAKCVLQIFTLSWLDANHERQLEVGSIIIQFWQKLEIVINPNKNKFSILLKFVKKKIKQGVQLAMRSRGLIMS